MAQGGIVGRHLSPVLTNTISLRTWDFRARSKVPDNHYLFRQVAGLAQPGRAIGHSSCIEYWYYEQARQFGMTLADSCHSAMMLRKQRIPKE